MRNRRWPTAPAVAAVATILVAGAALASPRATRWVVTGRPAQLVATASGVTVHPILSAGDLVGGELFGYQMAGVPGGVGAYRSSPSAVEVLVNHELDGEAPEGVGARVSQLTLDDRRRVLAGRYLLDGSEGFLRLCSGTLATLDGVPWYFTGEGSTDQGEPPTGGRGGSSIALNVASGRWTETRHFGLFEHEHVVPVPGLRTAMVVSTEGGEAGTSQLYAYTAADFATAIAGHGQLWVWAADDKGDGDPSTDDIASGQTLQGRFVALSQADNADAATLEAAAQARGAFDFVRVKGLAVSRTRPGEAYLTDGGAAGAETERGRLYRLRIDPADPTRASLTLVLDGDAGDDLVNPDNLDVSERVAVIQEDRNPEHRGAGVAGGYARVLVYDLDGGQLRTVARVATDLTAPGAEPGSWASSGVLDASGLYGEDWWLLTVQAHTARTPQPGPDLSPGSSQGEDGQLLAVRIPGST